MMLKEQIRSLVNEVLNAITNPELKELVRTKTFLTGGCFKALYHSQDVNDYDFYFIDEESKNRFLQIIEEGLQKPRTEAFTKTDELYMAFKYRSEFTMTFILDGEVKIQFITKYTGVPEKVTNNFDFKHTMNYYVPAFDAFSINEDNLREKKLMFNPRASHPVNALKRMQKFIQQGWTIDDPEIMGIAQAINRVDLTSDDGYREQASGMYLYRESIMRGYNSKRNVG